MTGSAIDASRRRFLFGGAQPSGRSAAAAADAAELAAARRRRGRADAYESELRAFGPEVAATTAHSAGVGGAGADYGAVARALAETTEETSHEC